MTREWSEQRGYSTLLIIPYSRVVKRTSLISAYSLLGAGLILLLKYFLLSAPL